MFDMVPPQPIGLNADILVDRSRQFYWCKEGDIFLHYLY